MDGVGCSGLAPASPSCVAYCTGYATFTGTVSGDERYELDTSVSPDGKILYEGAAFFAGGVQGCGQGSYILDGADDYIDMKKYDPVTSSAPGFNKWHYGMAAAPAS